MYMYEDDELDITEDMTLKGEVYHVVDLEFPTLGLKIFNVCIIDMTYWPNTREYYTHDETRKLMCGNHNYSMVIQMSTSVIKEPNEQTQMVYYPYSFAPETRQEILKAVYKHGQSTFMLINDMLSTNDDGVCCGSVTIRNNIFHDIKSMQSSLENSRPFGLRSNRSVFFIDTTDFCARNYPNSIGEDIMRAVIHRQRPDTNIRISILFEGSFSGLFSIFCDPCISGSSNIPFREIQNQQLKAYHIEDNGDIQFDNSNIDIENLDLRDDPAADLRRENSMLREEIIRLKREAQSYSSWEYYTQRGEDVEMGDD